jgi:enoyl-[acyl-carrier-protein] reductase (NADH)
VAATKTPKRRPGGRSARVRAAAIEATLAELAHNGDAGLSLEEMANMAAFMASDQASGMTGTTVNLTMGSLDD